MVQPFLETEVGEVVGAEFVAQESRELTLRGIAEAFNSRGIPTARGEVRTVSRSSTLCTAAARSARPRCMRSTSWSSDGEDLRGLPLGDRKKRLARLLGRRRLGIVLSAHTGDDGATIFQQACKLGLSIGGFWEGMMSGLGRFRFRSDRRLHNQTVIRAGDRRDCHAGTEAHQRRRSGKAGALDADHRGGRYFVKQDGKVGAIEVAGLHPATDSVVPYILGHVIPVPSEP
jgi:hypothetical protein